MSVVYAIKNSIRMARTGVTIHEIQVREAESEEVKAMDLLLNKEVKIPFEFPCMKTPDTRKFMENRMHKIPAYEVKVLAAGTYTGRKTTAIVWAA